MPTSLALTVSPDSPDAVSDRSVLLPLIERVCRLLLHLLELLNQPTLRFSERRRLDRILSRVVTVAAASLKRRREESR